MLGHPDTYIPGLEFFPPIFFDHSMPSKGVCTLFDELLTNKSPLAVDRRRVVPLVAGAGVRVDAAPEGDPVAGLAGAVLGAREEHGRVWRRSRKRKTIKVVGWPHVKIPDGPPNKVIRCTFLPYSYSIKPSSNKVK